MTAVEDILAHHGVKGQKWGVRRRSSHPDFLISDDARKASRAASAVKKNGTQILSNEDLQRLVTRMNLEKQFKTLQPPTKSQAAKRFIANLLLNAGKQQAQIAVNAAVAKQVGSILKKP